MADEIKQLSAGADATARIYNADGWDVFHAGMAKANKINSVTFGSNLRLGREDITALYRYGGFARKIVDLPAFEMTRQWIRVDGDEKGLTLKRMEELGARNIFRDALRWADMFGGSLIVMILDDGRLLDQPLETENLRDIVDLRVYDRHQVTWTAADVDEDLLSKNYGKPAIYTISPYTSGVIGAQFRVHHTRVLRFEGADLPNVERVRNDGWGDTVYHSLYEELRNLGIVNNSTAGIVQDFIQTIIQIDNLAELIASGQEELVKKRLNLIDLGRNIMKTILLDKEESYEKKASSVAGLGDLIDRAMIMLSGAGGIPVTKLFGRSPAGLSATGESDTRNFYDDMKGKQEDKLLPPLEYFVELIMLSRDGPFKGQEPADWKIVFNPLWQMTDTETATWRKTVAETDKIYIENNVIDPTEVALSRFGGDRYSAETTLDKGFREKDLSLPEPEPEPVIDPLTGKAIKTPAAKAPAKKPDKKK